MPKRYAVLLSAVLLFSALWGQDRKPENVANAMPNMDMAGHNMSDMPGRDAEGGVHAMHSMENRHMGMGPHMKMTGLRNPQPGDSERAAQVVAAARQVAAKYTDYKTALADGFEIFLPRLPQKQYHITNSRYAFEAALHFNPDHPTSLLYEKRGDGYRLIGVMYTAPKNFSEDELNQRIPLSIAQWHAHVNLCVPPPTKETKCGDRTRSSDSPARSAQRTPAPPRGEVLSPRSLAGWCMFIRSSKSPKTFGPLRARPTARGTERNLILNPPGPVLTPVETQICRSPENLPSSRPRW